MTDPNQRADKSGFSLTTWGAHPRFAATGLPSIEACTAVYKVLWKLEEFEDEDWLVVRPGGTVLIAINYPFEHEDGEVYCTADDVEWWDSPSQTDDGTAATEAYAITFLNPKDFARIELWTGHMGPPSSHGDEQN